MAAKRSTATDYGTYIPTLASHFRSDTTSTEIRHSPLEAHWLKMCYEAGRPQISPVALSSDTTPEEDRVEDTRMSQRHKAGDRLGTTHHPCRSSACDPLEASKPPAC